MAEKGSSTKRARVHVRDRDYTLYVQKRGRFTVLAPSGRYNESLLAAVVGDFLGKPDYLAADLSGLDAVSLPLVRAFCEYAAGLEPGAGKMVLLRPPDKIRSLVKLVGRLDKVPFALSEADLEGTPEQVEDRIRAGQDRFQLVKQMLQSNPCWQLVDAGSRWLCPFCATFREGIQYVAKGAPSQTVLERISAHLGEECSTYRAGMADGWPFEVLERVAAKAIQEQTELTPAPAKRKKREEAELGGQDLRRRRLLPTAAPAIQNFQAEICYLPAAELSGDFYDFVRLPDGRTALVVGDVSGHGIDPGVLMGMARKTISIRLREQRDPARALELANDDLCSELEGESFVTATVAVIDGARREVGLAAAGHAAPFLVRAGTAERLECPGPVLGLVPAAGFEQAVEARKLQLGPGDVLFFHTDALEELQGGSGEKFGADRIASVLRSHADERAGLILGAMIMEAEQFALGMDRAGDLAAVCVKVL